MVIGPCRFARGRLVSDDAWMASEPDSTANSEQEWVVIASFPNRHAAEHMLASLGPGFRRNANKGHAEAFLITGNADGSLKLRKSRVLEAGGLASTIARIAVFVMVGLIGVVAMFKGAKATAHVADKHQAHVGADEQHAHAILAQAGPDAAIALVHCKDRETGKTVAAGAAVPAIAGTARCQTSSPRSTRAASTTGCATLSTSRQDGSEDHAVATGLQAAARPATPRAMSLPQRTLRPEARSAAKLRGTADASVRWQNGLLARALPATGIVHDQRFQLAGGRADARGVSVYGSRVLEVKGRKSGEWRQTPVNLLRYDSADYLVAPRGHTQWVKNLHASRQGRLRVSRRTEPFTAVELADDEKPPLLRAYLKKWKFEVGVFFGGVGPDSSDQGRGGSRRIIRCSG